MRVSGCVLYLASPPVTFQDLQPLHIYIYIYIWVMLLNKLIVHPCVCLCVGGGDRSTDIIYQANVFNVSIVFLTYSFSILFYLILSAATTLLNRQFEFGQGWKKRWMILCHASERGPNHIEQFENREATLMGYSCEVINLEEVTLEQDLSFVLNLYFVNDKTRKFATDSSVCGGLCVCVWGGVVCVCKITNWVGIL